MTIHAAEWAEHPETPITVQVDIDAPEAANADVNAAQDALSQKPAAARVL
jgi:hypothetical protein